MADETTQEVTPDADESAGPEVVSDSELDAEFDAIDGDQPSEGGEQKSEVDDQKSEDGKEPGATAEDGKGDEAGAGEESTALKAVEKRAQEREAAAAKQQAEEKAAAEAAKRKAADSTTETTPLAALVTDGIDEALKDETFLDGDEEISFAEASERYPLIAKMMTTVVPAMLERFAEKMLTPHVAELAELREFRESYEQESAQDAVYSALADEKYGHADAREVTQSAEFRTWFDALPASMQALGQTGDLEDYASLLTAYKEVDELRTKQREKHKARKDVLKASSRVKAPAPRKAETVPTEEELDAEFAEEAAK